MSLKTSLRTALFGLYALAFAITVFAVSDTVRARGEDSSQPPATVSFLDPSFRERGEIAVAQITYDWENRLPGWRIEFVAGDSDIAGYTWSRQSRIEVFVRPGATSADLARILAHELGHAIDVTHNNADERQMWLDVRNAPDAPWWPDTGAADFATGAGDFAEVFTVTQIGDADYRGELAPPPTAAELALILELASN